MKSKLASKRVDTLSLYLDERGRYDIRKSEDRRIQLKHTVSSNISRFDLIRNREIHEKNAISKFVNVIFGL